MRLLIAVVFGLAVWSSAFAQQSMSDVPASKEDVQRHFDVMHFHGQMQNVMKAMSESLKNMAHERCLKQKEQTPEKCEAEMNSHLDDALKTLPLDEMIQAMTPVLQKPMTNADVDALVAFYSSSTGQKMLREQPAMTTELMQAVMPIMERRTESMQKQMEQEIAQMEKDSGQKSDPSATKPRN